MYAWEKSFAKMVHHIRKWVTSVSFLSQLILWFLTVAAISMTWRFHLNLLIQIRCESDLLKQFFIANKTKVVDNMMNLNSCIWFKQDKENSTIHMVLQSSFYGGISTCDTNLFSAFKSCFMDVSVKTKSVRIYFSNLMRKNSTFTSILGEKYPRFVRRLTWKPLSIRCPSYQKFHSF